jgi:hypothetical protein
LARYVQHELGNKGEKEIEKVTENELILFLCKQKGLGMEGSNEELIRKFRETYRDQGNVITKAARGGTKSPRRLRWICGLKVFAKTNHAAEWG